MRTGLLWATMATMGSMMMIGAAPAEDDPLAMSTVENFIGQAPLSGRRTDEDDPLAALEQGKGLTVELTQLPTRNVDAQAIGSGAMVNFGDNHQGPPPAPPPSSNGGTWGSLFPGFNFGN